MNEDAQQLNLLATFHYVVAVMTAFIGCFPIIHLVVGIALITGQLDNNRGDGPPVWFGFMFAAMALMAIAMMWAMAIALCMAAGRLKSRTHYTFCLVVAAIACIFMPFGTVLGVFTIIVLMRPSVQALFRPPDSILGC